MVYSFLSSAQGLYQCAVYRYAIDQTGKLHQLFLNYGHFASTPLKYGVLAWNFPLSTFLFSFSVED